MPQLPPSAFCSRAALHKAAKFLCACPNPSRAPGQGSPAGGETPGVEHVMHWGTGAVLGSLRGMWAVTGIRGALANTKHTAVRLAFDQTLERMPPAWAHHPPPGVRKNRRSTSCTKPSIRLRQALPPTAGSHLCWSPAKEPPATRGSILLQLLRYQVPACGTQRRHLQKPYVASAPAPCRRGPSGCLNRYITRHLG